MKRDESNKGIIAQYPCEHIYALVSDWTRNEAKWLTEFSELNI